jgi:hypothetical protein
MCQFGFLIDITILQMLVKKFYSLQILQYQELQVNQFYGYYLHIYHILDMRPFSCI